MGFWAYIIVGLVAGFLAKLVMPGNRNEPGGFLGTMLLGVVDTDTDRQAVALRAREVTGVLGVENNLVVSRE